MEQHTVKTEQNTLVWNERQQQPIKDLGRYLN